MKGFDRLIDSFAAIHDRCPEWRLDIIGDGEEYEALRKRTEELGASAYIRLCGRYSPDEVAAGNNDGKININTADETTLTGITGIGTTRAKSIIKYRETYGNFKKPEDIKNVSGIGDASYEKMKDEIKVD